MHPIRNIAREQTSEATSLFNRIVIINHSTRKTTLITTPTLMKRHKAQAQQNKTYV